MGTGSTNRLKRAATVGLGTVFFGVVAGAHGLMATGAGSIPLLGVLWIFTPAPVVFFWRWMYARKTPGLVANLAPRVYLSLAPVVAVAVLLGVGWVASERGINPAGCETTGKTLQDFPHLEPMAEVVTFTVPQGGNRAGWFIPGESRATVILLHGFGCGRQGMLEHARILHNAGYSTLLFDFRGRGDSDGDAVTLGYYEQRDALAAIEYLKTRSDVDSSNLGVLGVSMGASVAIMAAAQAPEVQAVVADSPFESAERAVEEGFTRVVGLPAFPFAPVTLEIIQWRLGISPRNVVPRENVADISPRPLLIIHGTADTEVSPWNSEVLFDAAGEPKELWLIPDGCHTCGIKDPNGEYSRRIVQFFDRYLN